jgi:hypothetical protein
MRRIMNSHRSGASGARSTVRPAGMTVGEILDTFASELELDPAVTPWRRGHQTRLRAAVGYQGLW